MPEDTQLALPRLALLQTLYGRVHAQVLVVLGHNLHGLLAAVVEENEVFEDVEEVFFAENAAQQRLHLDRAAVLLFQALPLLEKLDTLP